MTSESNSAAKSENDPLPARRLVRVPLPPEILAVEDAVLDGKGNDGKPKLPRRPRVGLALSGGGIRSACFNLGLLQALAGKAHNSGTLLKRVDYLSTVSGGGYIGSWLVSCLREKPGFKPQDETPELDHLRKFARYLSPQGGFFSADAWTMAMIWLRNTVLLQVMLCCFLGSLLMLPRLWRLVFQDGWETVTLGGTIFLFAVAMVAIFFELTRMLAVGGNVQRQGFVQWLIVIPLLAAAGLFAAHAWIHRDNTSHLMWVSGCVAFVSFAAVCLSLERRVMDRPLFPIAGSILIGAACGGLFAGLLHVILSFFDGWSGELAGVWKAAVWGAPLILVALTAVVILLIGLAGRAMPDGTREWWSRLWKDRPLPDASRPPLQGGRLSYVGHQSVDEEVGFEPVSGDDSRFRFRAGLGQRADVLRLQLRFGEDPDPRRPLVYCVTQSAHYARHVAHALSVPRRHSCRRLASMVIIEVSRRVSTRHARVRAPQICRSILEV